MFPSTERTPNSPLAAQLAGINPPGLRKGGPSEGHLLFPSVRSCLFLNAGLAGTGVPSGALAAGLLWNVDSNLDGILLLLVAEGAGNRVSVTQLY